MQKNAKKDPRNDPKRLRKCFKPHILQLHCAAKEGRQKGIGKKVTKTVKKVTRASPKRDRN